MRCFVSVELPEKAKEQVAGFQHQALKALSPYAKLKPVESQNLHLTLAFIGDLSGQEAEKAKKALRTVRQPRFPVIISSPGFFGPVHSPRVIFLKAISLELLEMSKKIHTALKTAKIPIKTQATKPHLTLFRIKHVIEPAQLAEEIKALSNSQFSLKHEVHSFELMKSTLTLGGPVYNIIEPFPLQ